MPASEFIFYPQNYKDLVGYRFGRLTVIERLGPSHHGHRWKSICDCGGFAYSRTDSLKGGAARSCGCLAKEAAHARKTHGMKHTRIYKTWLGMRQRCSNPNNIGYQDYGGRGITVCPEWERFEQFFQDMGHPPSPQHSLDRIDNDKGYSSDNCQWADRKQQMRNRRNTRFLTFKDQTKSLAEWAEIIGLPQDRLYARLRRGWSVEAALQTPLRLR